MKDFSAITGNMTNENVGLTWIRRQSDGSDGSPNPGRGHHDPPADDASEPLDQRLLSTIELAARGSHPGPGNLCCNGSSRFYRLETRKLKPIHRQVGSNQDCSFR